MSARNPQSQRRAHSSWYLSSELPGTATFSDHIVWAAEAVRRLPYPLDSADIAGADLFVGVFLDGPQGSVDLTAADAKRLADVGLAVVFDFYGGGDDG